MLRVARLVSHRASASPPDTVIFAALSLHPRQTPLILEAVPLGCALTNKGHANYSSLRW